MVEGRGFETSGHLDMSRFPGGDPDTAVLAGALLELRAALWAAPLPTPSVSLDELIAAAVAGGGDPHHRLLPADRPDPGSEGPFDADRDMFDPDRIDAERIDAERIDAAAPGLGAGDLDQWISGPAGDPGGDGVGWAPGADGWSGP